MTFAEQARVGDLGVELVRRWIVSEGFCLEGRHVVVEKGTHAREIQQRLGDLIIQSAKDRALVSIEVKAELQSTGNLFIETWSNSTPGPRQRVGWLHRLECDALIYTFLDSGQTLIFPFQDLKRWALTGGADGDGRIYDFRLVAQSKNRQLNVTEGHIVPIRVLLSEIASAHEFWIAVKGSHGARFRFAS